MSTQYPEWENWSSEEISSYRYHENQELRLIYALKDLPPRSPGARAKFIIGEVFLAEPLDYEGVMKDVGRNGRPSALHKLEDMAVMYLRAKARNLDEWPEIKTL